MKFGGLAEITSEYFEDHGKVFKSVKPKEDYPWRVSIKSEISLTPDQYLDVRELGPQMKYTKKWPVEHWRLAFQGNLHQIPEEDYKWLAGDRVLCHSANGVKEHAPADSHVFACSRCAGGGRQKPGVISRLVAGKFRLSPS